VDPAGKGGCGLPVVADFSVRLRLLPGSACPSFAGTIGILKAVLLAIDLALMLSRPLGALLLRCRRFFRPQKDSLIRGKDRAQVVVVGASFAGLEALHHLQGHENVDVVLVTDRPYFEYTPGVLRCFVKPEHFYALACALPVSSKNVLIGTATAIDTDHVEVAMAAGACSHPERLPFDHCLVTVGNAYKETGIKPSPSELTMAHRAATWMQAHKQLLDASSVLIIGGGLVGVELAAEIAVALPAIGITLVHSRQELCGELPPAARAYIQQWLLQHKVTLKLGRRVQQLHQHECVLDDDEGLRFSHAYQCTGGEGRSNFKGCGEESVDPLNYLKTSDTLQVLGKKNVWSAGDAMQLNLNLNLDLRKSQYQVKNAHTAEQTAKLAAQNILRRLAGDELLNYPEGIAGKGKSVPKIYCVSLGPYDGVLVFNVCVCVCGCVGV
jgi:apoptosis-inducing factor 2